GAGAAARRGARRVPVPHTRGLQAARARPEPGRRRVRRRAHRPRAGADVRARGRAGGPRGHELRARLQALVRAGLHRGLGVHGHRGGADRPQPPARRVPVRAVLRHARLWRTGREPARAGRPGERAARAGDPVRDQLVCAVRARGAQQGSMSVLAALLFAASTLRITVPYALAASGASLGERGGVVCLGLEGFMLNTALAYVLGAWSLQDPWPALGCAVVMGMLTAGLHALVTVAFRADQITSGIGINLLAAGLTRFVLVTVFHSSSNSPRVAGLPELPLGALSDLPALGPLLETPLVLLTLVLVPTMAWLGVRTPWGLRLRATGELPAASAALGLSVGGLRTSGVLVCGALSGLAGAWLASEQHCFTDNMTGGRGYIAIAAMIVGKWHPAGAAAACVLFGAAEAAPSALPGSRLPTALLQTPPHAVTKRGP